MPYNPFISLLQDPIQTLTLAGYATLMLTITLGGLAYTIRVGFKLIVTADRQHRQRNWWGTTASGWVPPEEWLADAAKLTIVVALLCWALATIVYMVT